MFKKMQTVINVLQSKWLAQNLDYLTNNLVKYMVNNYSSAYILKKFETLKKAENFSRTKMMYYKGVIPERIDINGNHMKIKGSNLLQIACATNNLELADKLIKVGFPANYQDKLGYYAQDYLDLNTEDKVFAKKIYDILNAQKELKILNNELPNSETKIKQKML